MEEILSKCNHFLKNHNTGTRGIPAEQVKTYAGLVIVLQFVEAIKRVDFAQQALDETFKE